MTDSEISEPNEDSAIIKITTTPKADLNSVQFDESNLLLLKKYRDWEESLKSEYYKSNPLRNYVSSIHGKSILPTCSKTSQRNKKKSLPKIFNELRTTENFQQDRELHRKKLCASLNITLDSLDVLNKKNPIDLLEESKKIYSEYCKYNLTKPIDLTNVESILKNNFLRKSDTNSSQHNSNDFEDSESISSSRSSLNSDYSASSQSNENKKLIDNKDEFEEWEALSNLNINAKPVKLKDLNDIDNDIREHKKKLAQSKQDAVRMKHNYRIIENASKSNNYSNEKLQQLKPRYYQHRGSVYNYRQNRTKISNQMTNVDRTEDDLVNYPNNKQSLAKSQIMHPNSCDYLLDERENTGNLPFNVPRVSVNNLSCVGTEFCYESTEHMKTYKSNLYNENINNPNVLKQNEKRMRRVQNARDKILNENIEKTNLNKMTILQPFEDTKILINIDKVSSKILNSLLNKHDTVPRYYMPPIKSFGYFKKVITNDPSSLIASTTYGTGNTNIAGQSNASYTDHLNKHNQHHHHSNIARLESLKSLSEQASKAPTFYFDDEIDSNKYNEPSVLNQLNINVSSAKKSDASNNGLDAHLESNSKGIVTS